MCVSHALSTRLPDVWVNETERSQLKTKVVHLSQLPQDTAMLLDPNIYRCVFVCECVRTCTQNSARSLFVYMHNSDTHTHTHRHTNQEELVQQSWFVLARNIAADEWNCSDPLWDCQSVDLVFSFFSFLAFEWNSNSPLCLCLFVCKCRRLCKSCNCASVHYSPRPLFFLATRWHQIPPKIEMNAYIYIFFAFLFCERVFVHVLFALGQSVLNNSN